MYNPLSNVWLQVGDYFNAYPHDVLAIFDKVLHRKALELSQSASPGGQRKERRIRHTLHARITGTVRRVLQSYKLRNVAQNLHCISLCGVQTVIHECSPPLCPFGCHLFFGSSNLLAVLALLLMHSVVCYKQVFLQSRASKPGCIVWIAADLICHFFFFGN